MNAGRGDWPAAFIAASRVISAWTIAIRPVSLICVGARRKPRMCERR
jgi:hypothetical protein